MMFMSELPPWPRYRPIRVIGQGGYGTVYLCEDTEPTSALYEQQVAVKAISLSALSDEEALMVMSEVSLLKNIDHPNIIRYYDSFLYTEEAGEEEGSEGPQWLCLVTEYMDGGDLSSLLKRYTTPAAIHAEQHTTSPAIAGGADAASSPSPALCGVAAQGSASSPSLLEGPYSDDMFLWDNTSDAEASATLLLHSPHPAAAAVGVLAERPGAGLPKRSRSADSTRAGRRSNKADLSSAHRASAPAAATAAGVGGGGSNSEEMTDMEDWQRLSSQHRRRLASTLRLSEHPFASVMKHSATAANSHCEAVEGAAMQTWVSDAAAGDIPKTPLGATELGVASQASGAHTLLSVKSNSSLHAAVNAAAAAPQPPNPRQLWVESFLITDIAKQCLDALAYLHALGILHRDIKPSNIYLSQHDGTVKIGDFGVSKLLQPAAPFATTFVGTPFYLCPELCMGDPYSFGADVWALGVLLYELYCLRLPFTADNVLGQIYVITEGVYDTAALRQPHVFAPAQRAVLEALYGSAFAQSEELLHGLVVELVTQMLSLDPAQRPSAETLLTRVFGAGGALSRAGSSAGASIAPTPLHRPPSAGLLQPPTQGEGSGPGGVAETMYSYLSFSGSIGAAGTAPATAASLVVLPNQPIIGSSSGGGAGRRLGPLATDEHARWAGSLVQAAAAARTTPQPRLSAADSSLESAATAMLSSDAAAVKEPLAIKVRLNMLDILQEMPYEQRGRLESRAAEDDAYDAQRLRVAAAAQTPLAATASAGAPEQPRLSSAYGSLGDYAAPQLLPPTFVPTRQLYGGSSGSSSGATPAVDAYVTRKASALQVSAVDLSSPVSAAEDSLDRLIGADTRGELSAFLDEVPWLQNADVFSAIPLVAGCDDVMLVARAGAPGGHRASISSRGNAREVERRAVGSSSGSWSRPGSAAGWNRSPDMLNGPEVTQEPQEQQQHSAPAVHYAGSVTRSNPNIEVRAMPHSTQKRQRTSIVGTERVTSHGDGNGGTSSPLPTVASQQQQVEERSPAEEETQRRISQGCTSPSPPSSTEEHAKAVASSRQWTSVLAAAAAGAISSAGENTHDGGNDSSKSGDDVEAAEREYAHGVSPSRPSSPLLREGNAAGARVRPVSSANGGRRSANASVAEDFGLSLEARNKREGLTDFPVAPLSTAVADVPSVPHSPTKVQMAGRCEGLSTSELERLLRAKLQAHYRKRQQLLRARRAEVAAQEAARSQARERLEAVYTATYTARMGTASPDTVRDTASYHSDHTFDTLLSTDEEAAAGAAAAFADDPAEKPRRLARVATLPPVPGTATTPSRPLPSPRQPTKAPTSAASPVHTSPHTPGTLELDQTARQVAKEAQVLRSLASARHASARAGSPRDLDGASAIAAQSVNSSREQEAAATTGTTTTSGETPRTPPKLPSEKSGTSSSPASQPPLQTTTSPLPEDTSADAVVEVTPAVRQLRQAAVLAAAVEVQKQTFRSAAAAPARLQVAPPWRPPRCSKDVPTLWETSSAEEEAESDARGRPGRPAPAHVRAEVRWRWSAPPSDLDTEGEEGSTATDTNTASSASASASSPRSTASLSRIGSAGVRGRQRQERRKARAEQRQQQQQQHPSQRKTHRSAADNKEEAPLKATALTRQSSLLGSPMELRQEASSPHSFPSLPTDKDDQSGSPGPARVRRHRSHASSDENSASISNSRRTSVSGSGVRRTRQKAKRAARDASRTASTSPENTTSSEDTSSSSSSSSSSSDGSLSETEDMSYAYTALVDADTGSRYFDYLCPVTVELVGELPAACRVATWAQAMAQLLPQSLSPSRSTTTMTTATMATITAPSGLPDFTADSSLMTPSPPPPASSRQKAAAAPSPRAESNSTTPQPDTDHQQKELKETVVLSAQEDGNGEEEKDMGEESMRSSGSRNSSGKSSLFEDCSLLLRDSPRPPPPPPQTSAAAAAAPSLLQDGTPTKPTAPVVAKATKLEEEGVKSGKDVATAQPAPSHSTETKPATLPRSSSCAVDTTAPRNGGVKDKKGEGRSTGDMNDASKAHNGVDSMVIFGTKVAAAPITTTATTTTATAAAVAVTAPPPSGAAVSRKSRRKAAGKHISKNHKKSLNSTVGSLSEHGGTWRVRVPPTADTSANTHAASTAAGAFIRLPLSLALRPMRQRTRFVGLLWRLWLATQFADPALRRVVLGGDRCNGAGGTCTFGEAFGDWTTAQAAEGHESTASASSSTMTTAASTQRTTAMEQSTSRLDCTTVQERSMQEAASSLPVSLSATISSGVLPARRWTLYYVEPRLSLAVRLRSDAEWAVVRQKVTEMGQLLPFIRLYLVLHDAECA